MENLKERTLRKFFQAVGQPERLKMLGMMANRPYSVAELADMLGIRETAVQHHLTRLQKMDLVTENAKQFAYTYQLNSNALAQLEQIIIDDVQVENFRDQVVAQYVQNNRLQHMPTDPKELRIILEWVAAKFEPGKRYSESRVNSIIMQHYARPELLRRHLLDKRLIKQVGDIYWRPLEETD